MNYLLDTNVVSELVAKHPNDNVLEWVRSLDEECLYLSVITIGEIKKGIEKMPVSPRKDKLNGWLVNDLLKRFEHRLVIIDVDVMLAWGELTARLERNRRMMPSMDALIVALSLVGNLTLVTRNTDDFNGAGINLLNPWEQEPGR
jgi:predicted nucleic acid-binding protein